MLNRQYFFGSPETQGNLELQMVGDTGIEPVASRV